MGSGNTDSGKLRILITGGTGYLGGRLVQNLREAGHDVLVHGRDETPGTLTADITDKAAVTSMLEKATRKKPIDAVIHLAAVNEHTCLHDQALAFNVNCFGTQHVIDAAATVGVKRFIYFSTFHVYGDAEGTITEETIPNPLFNHGITHLVAEFYCKATAKKRGLELAIIRLSNVIGIPASETVDRWTLLLLDLCRQAHERGAMTLHTAGYQLRDFVSIDDLGQAVRLLLAADAASLKNPVFNVGSGRAVSVRSMARVIQAEYEKLYHKVLPLHFADDGGKPSAKLEFSIKRIGALGYAPTTDIAAVAKETLVFCERFRVAR